jgi:hypothetical protein
MPLGRPAKFAEPSNPVTVTLPHRILRQLEALDSDRGKAIVKCVEEITATSLSNEKSVEIVKISENTGLIVVRRCQSLESIPWLRLIEIAPNRFILSISPGTNITSLEVAIMDLLEHEAAGNHNDKVLLEELRRCIAHHRRKDEVTKGEILFIDL